MAASCSASGSAAGAAVYLAVDFEGGSDNCSDVQPSVVSGISGFSSAVEFAVLLSKEEGFITVFSDSVRCHYYYGHRIEDKAEISCEVGKPDGTCGVYSEQMRRLFIGMANGVITELIVSNDCNKLSNIREYPCKTVNECRIIDLVLFTRAACTAALAAVFFSITCELLLSTGKDNSFVWQFDSESKYVFLGDSAGNVSVFRFRDMNCEFVSRLSAHTGSVSSLSWDAARQLLFSASHDKLIIVWDIGSCKGTAFELMGHKTKITSLAYSPSKLKLLSADESGCVVCWDMNIQRQETPEWKTSNVCQCCGDPFFWNMKDMWNKKTVGLRQHHCRICGKAVCDKCSQNRIRYPPMGYELAVRICIGCFREYGSRTFKSLAKFFDAKHRIFGIHFNDTEDYLLTAGTNSVDVSR
ncbi:unnamed protein product [Soboliphyme baturini]|uniref:FYVE-type domain-containing protein n=1 Tax=Soboliphyme baturini TaxID=241478 RepID=A0A183ITE3_9BILA|nr:unnamed protein product [Soboliphyme baturini]